MRVYTNGDILPVITENIPDELRRRPQWVVWKAVWKAVGEKPDKVPYSAQSGCRASTTDLLTWATFDEACVALETGEYNGLGFVFSSGDPCTGVDLDECVNPQTGEVAVWALGIIEYLDSYTELSATGTRVHIILKGEVPNRRKKGIEVYSAKRFFAMTGRVLEVDDD